MSPSQKNLNNPTELRDAFPLLVSGIISPLSLGKTNGYFEVNEIILNPFSTFWIVANMDARLRELITSYSGSGCKLPENMAVSVTYKGNL